MMVLYSGTTCPFSQRCRFVLFEKGMDFEIRDVDLYNKPEDIAIMNPYGQVPILVERDLIGARIDAEQDVAGLDPLIFLHIDLDDPAGHVGAYRDEILADIGVVGRFVGAGERPDAPRGKHRADAAERQQSDDDGRGQ